MLKNAVRIEEPKQDKSPISRKHAEEVVPVSQLYDMLPGRYQYKNGVLELQGIEEDFKVFFNGELVCEIILDNVYNLNASLALKLFD